MIVQEKRYSPHLLAIIFIMMAILEINCTGSFSSRKYHYLQLNGSNGVANYSVSSQMYFADRDSLHWPLLSVATGDFIDLGGFNFYIFDKHQDHTIDFQYRDSLTYINEKLSSITWSDTTDMLPFFKEMKDKNIEHLQSLNFSVPLPESYYPYLEKIARKNPKIGLYVTIRMPDNDSLTIADKVMKERGEKDFNWLLDKFNPTWIIVNLDYDHLKLLAKAKSCSLLYLDLSNDSAKTGNLPVMPALKQLFISVDNDEYPLSTSFLSLNPQIESLSYEVEDNPDLGFLKYANNLTKLQISHFDTLVDLRQIRHLKNLDRLILDGSQVNDISGLKEFSHITWLGLPVSITQSAFDTIMEQHSSLEVISFNSGIKVDDLHSLAGMKNMHTLLIGGDSMHHMKNLDQLNQLELLSIPQKNFKDLSYIHALQKALPDTTLVPNSGLCLGSGWLLLIIPMALMARFVLHKPAERWNIFPYKNSKQHAA